LKRVLTAGLKTQELARRRLLTATSLRSPDSHRSAIPSAAQASGGHAHLLVLQRGIAQLTRDRLRWAPSVTTPDKDGISFAARSFEAEAGSARKSPLTQRRDRSLAATVSSLSSSLVFDPKCL
jgi:hypothetical protein